MAADWLIVLFVFLAGCGLVGLVKYLSGASWYTILVDWGLKGRNSK